MAVRRSGSWETDCGWGRGFAVTGKAMSGVRGTLAGMAVEPLFAVAGLAVDNDDWPEAWYQTASELGIGIFAQSPYLDDRDLPPVEERLPKDPVVIEPYRSIGKYGGTARIPIWDSLA